MLGVGGALVLGAIPLWLRGASIASELSANCPDRGCATDPSADIETARSFALAGDIVAGLGVAGILVGVVMLATRGAAPRAPTASVSCDGRGCAAGLRVAF